MLPEATGSQGGVHRGHLSPWFSPVPWRREEELQVIQVGLKEDTCPHQVKARR